MALFDAGRAIGALALSFSAMSCGMKVVTSFGECSPSRSSQSKPATPSTSVVVGLASEHQQPIRVSPASRRWRKLFGKARYGAGVDIGGAFGSGARARGG